MDAYQELIKTLSLTMGVAWASGINLYAAIAMLGILGNTGNIVLPEGLMVVQDPLVMWAACVMYVVEFVADKTPGVDTGWDAIHSFIRIPAGVMLAASAVGDVTPALVVAAGIMGGTVSSISHSLKAGSRVLINTSPEPVSNWIASFTEDLLVISGLWVALQHPSLFLVLFVLFIALAIWALPKICRGLCTIFKKIRNFFKPKDGGPKVYGPLGANSNNSSGSSNNTHPPVLK